MNLLFLSNLYPPNTVGGYERLCFEVASALAGRNHRVSVLTSDYGGRIEDYPGQEVDRSLRLLVDDRDIYRPFSASNEERHAIARRNAELLRGALERLKPEVLFVWNLFFFDRSLLDTVQEARCGKVFLLTDNWLISFLRPRFWQAYFDEEVLASPSFARRIRNAVFGLAGRRRWDRHAIRIRGRAVFPSRFMERLYRQAGFTFQGTAVVPHGVHLKRRPDSDYRDRTFPVEKGRLRLLFAGRVVEMKGVHTILEALPEILKGVPDADVRLTILGDTRDIRYLERLQGTIRDRGLSECVDFRPPVREPDLFRVFQEHDIYLFPSLYEPFSLTLIHALEAGIPTVASDVGGNREIVFHGKTGLLFEKGRAPGLARAVLELVGSPGLRREVSREARRTARELTFDAMVRRIERRLEEGRCG